MVITNQKPIIDTHTKKEKETQKNIKIAIKSQRRGQKKKGTKKNFKNYQKTMNKW